MEPLSSLRLEDLNKRKSMLKDCLIALLILGVIVLLINLYVLTFKSDPVSLPAIIPLFVVPITSFRLYSLLKAVNEELKSRQPNDILSI